MCSRLAPNLTVMCLLATLLVGCQRGAPTLEATVYVPEFSPTGGSAPTRTPEPSVPPVPREAMAARDAAVAFIRRTETAGTIPERLLWVGENVSEDTSGSNTRFRYVASGWVVEVESTGQPESGHYVWVRNDASGFAWEGLVSGDFRVIPTSPPVPDKVFDVHSRVLTYLHEDLGEAFPPAEAWVALEVTPKGLESGRTYRLMAGEWVVTLDQHETADSTWSVRIWNQTTGYDWWGSVSADGEIRQTVYGDVVAWDGRIVPLCHVAQFDDYFERDDGERYGVAGRDDDVSRELERAACGRLQVRLWGELRPGVPDAGGRQLLVSRIEITGSETSVPVESVEGGPVGGWRGTVRSQCRSSEYPEYFERDDGQRFGLSPGDETTEQGLMMAACEELPVVISGKLMLDGGYQGRTIVLTSIEFAAD